MKLILAGLLLVTCLSAEARRREGGSVVENGGSYVLCAHNLPKDISSGRTAVLDIFEGSLGGKRHYTKLASFRNAKLSSAYDEAIKIFFARDVNLDSMLLHFSRFSQQIEFVDDRLLPDLKIESPIAAPNACEVKQAAVQYVPRLGEPDSAIQILIAKNVWRAMPTDQKIALLVHEFYEAIYYQLLGGCMYTEVRERVAFLLSDEALELPDREFERQNRFHCGM